MVFSSVSEFHMLRKAGQRADALSSMSDVETALIAPLKSVRIQLHPAPIAPYGPPENSVAAFRAHIAGFFILNPFFSADFSPVWNSPQYDLFADFHWKIFNVPAGKLIALMASGKTLLLCAFSDSALPAMHKTLIRHAAAALNVFC
jgi:hypothetical protein